MSDGWAAITEHPLTRVRLALRKAGPVLAVLVALAVAGFILWPRTEGVPDSSAPAATLAPNVEMPDNGMAPVDEPAPLPGAGTRDPVELPDNGMAPVDEPAPLPGAGTRDPLGAPEISQPGEESSSPGNPTAKGGGGTRSGPEAVAAFASRSGIAVVQPVAIPQGWRSDGIEVLAAAETPEQCEQSGLYWIDPNDATFGFLDLYQFDRGCASPPPSDALEFRAGRSQGWIVLDPRAGWRVELDLGDSVLQVYTDVDPARLQELLADLVTFDPTSSPPDSFSLIGS